MAISEQSPRPQSSEQNHTPDAASIASHVAWVVENLQKDRQTISDNYDLCRRADNAMVAMLEVVSPLLPDLVQEQVQSLISIHDALYQDRLPSPEQHMPEHE